MTQPLERAQTLEGQTYKIICPNSDHAIYITVKDVIQDSRRRPFEVFINSKNMEHYAWAVALTRMISAIFRRGGYVSFVVEELKPCSTRAAINGCKASMTRRYSPQSSSSWCGI